MFEQLKTSVLMVLIFSVVTGLAYPLAITGVAQLAFPKQAGGSLIMRDGTAVGSELIGQSFDAAEYFWGRPSATGPAPYNGGASGGSNLALGNPAQLDALRIRVAKLRAADPEQGAAVPLDLVTASGSGLDPHISPAAAAYQAARVARARGLPLEEVRGLVAAATEPPQWGLLGEARVNVLRLNLALDGRNDR